MKRAVTLNMGEMAIGGGDLVIQTSGIGSCVVITMYDETAQIGGMAHAMLPTRHNSDVGVVKSLKHKDGISTGNAKYVDESIERLVIGIMEHGGSSEQLQAKIIGGARMFHLLSVDNFTVGSQNIEAAKKKLLDMRVYLASEDTGGTIGRNAEIDLSSGLVTVRSVM